MEPERITYTELCQRLTGEPLVPVFHFERNTANRVTCYVPDWAPVPKQEQIQSRMQRHCKPAAVVVVLVTDVPHERLFGDWREAAGGRGHETPRTV